MASSSSSRNWVYDVFPSFSGEDVRVTFLSHFLKELDRKLIKAFKDNEIERSRSLDPELKQAIRDSKIAVVVFSEKYASSSWCLNELLEIVNCKESLGQLVIPVFYGLDPSHVRKQTGDFGRIFEETCKNKTELVKNQWQKALTDVANILGYHSATWGNEATMIGEIANDVLGKLLSTPSNFVENFVGIDDHIAQMSELLHLESEEVRMVGIWGSSGIGKTTIARTLFSRLSRHFQGRVYIDRHFISKSMDIFSKSNPDDYNMKLHLQNNFLSKILDRQCIEVDHLCAVKVKLKDMKVLIFVDDLDDQVVLDALVGGDEWFGPGSRIIVITKDKHILKGHGIKCIYEVGIPSEEVALQIFCQSAFRQNSPPNGFMELACEVVVRAGRLPLGLNLLGSSLRGRNEKYWVDMLPSLRKGLDGKIEKALRVSYDGLERKEYKALFRHIACLFNGYEIDSIKLMLADSELNVDIGLEILLDKSLVQVIRNTNIIEMHCLVQEMGKEIVRTQFDEPGEREFIFDPKDVCDVLEDSTGTKKTLGISLDIDEIDELWIHKEAFKGMRNLRFLNIYSKSGTRKKEFRWHLPEGFDYLPPKLRLLRLDKYPMRCMPSTFRPENLVKFMMMNTKLEQLWEGVHSLTGLKVVNLDGSKNLKEIPDLSMAIHLETLALNFCSSLVELGSSIQYLNKLERLEMRGCKSLESLPTGMNLKSLFSVILEGCSRLKSFPDISTNISMLQLDKTAIEEFPSNLRLDNLFSLDMCKLKTQKLWERVQPLTPLMAILSPSLRMLTLSDIPSLVELPSSFHNLHDLTNLVIVGCINLETLPIGINFKFLYRLNLSGCSRLKSFPDISNSIGELILSNTAIEKVPRWIENFYRLFSLGMSGCTNLKSLPTGINLETLRILELTGCSQVRSFPSISTNISCFDLSQTGIEEVPWWIENFAKLKVLTMRGCNNLKSVSLNISKLKHLERVDFSHCGALTEAILSDTPSVVDMEANHILSTEECYSPNVILDFTNCFNLDQEALIEQQTVFKSLILLGEELPSYFTHRATGTSLTIPLLQASLLQPFFKLKVGVVTFFDMSRDHNTLFIHVNCRFKGRLGCSFDSFGKKHVFWTSQKDCHLVILDCSFPLNEDNDNPAELNYDHVDVQLHMSSDYPTSYLKGWGIRLFEDCSSLENR